jgi:hypothetical protein
MTLRRTLPAMRFDRPSAVSTLWTSDASYRQFDGISMRDPFDPVRGGGGPPE